MQHKIKVMIFTLALLCLLTVTVQAKETTTLEEVPEDVRTACEKYGEEYNIAPELLEAIIWHESDIVTYFTVQTGNGVRRKEINGVYIDRFRAYGDKHAQIEGQMSIFDFEKGAADD